MPRIKVADGPSMEGSPRKQVNFSKAQGSSRNGEADLRDVVRKAAKKSQVRRQPDHEPRKKARNSYARRIAFELANTGDIISGAEHHTGAATRSARCLPHAADAGAAFVEIVSLAKLEPVNRMPTPPVGTWPLFTP